MTRRFVRFFQRDEASIRIFVDLSPMSQKRYLEAQLHRRPLWATARAYGLTRKQLDEILARQPATVIEPVGPHSLWMSLPWDYVNVVTQRARDSRERTKRRKRKSAHTTARPFDGCAAGRGVNR